MKRLSLVVLIFMMFFETSIAYAKSINIDSVAVGSGQTKVIEVDASNLDEINIKRILLEPKLNNNAGMTVVFEGIKRAQYENLSIQPEVSINIENIVSSSNSSKPDVNIYFRDLRVEKLKIEQSENTFSPIGSVSLDFQNASSLQHADLFGGDFGHISLNIERVLKKSNSSVGNINLKIRSFKNINLVGDELFPAILLNVSSDSARQAPHVGSSIVDLQLLTLLNSNIVLHNKSNRSNSDGFDPEKRICKETSSTTKITLERSIIGDSDDLYPNYPSGNGMKIGFPEDKCLSLELLSIRGEGQIDISTGGINQFTMHDISSNGPMGLGIQAEAKQIENLRFASTTLSNFNIRHSLDDQLKAPELHTWGSVKVRDDATLPVGIYDELDALLLEHSRERMKAVSGVREFLTSTAWKSYLSETGEPAFARSLHSVLYSDSTRIHGSKVATLLDWTTGFGIEFKKPLMFSIALLIVSLLFTFIVSGKKLENLKVFALAFFGFLKPKETVSAAVVRVAKLLRWSLLVQFTLFSLFLQNAILTG